MEEINSRTSEENPSVLFYAAFAKGSGAKTKLDKALQVFFAKYEGAERYSKIKDLLLAAIELGEQRLALLKEKLQQVEGWQKSTANL